MSILIAAIILLILFFWWFRRNTSNDHNFLNKLPEPSTSLPLLGVALDFSSTKELLNVLIKYTETYGPILKVKIGPFRQLILVSDYKLLEHVLSSTKLMVKSDEYYLLRPWLGTGLLTSDGRKWKDHRRVLTPAFHFQILEQFVQIFESCGNTLISKFETNLGKTSFDIYPYVTLCSLDVICESIIGVNINAQNDDESDYVKSVKNMCRIVMDRSTSAVEMNDWQYPFSRNFYCQRKALKILHKQSNDVITARREELAKMPQNSHQNQEEMYFKNKKSLSGYTPTDKRQRSASNSRRSKGRS